MSNNRNHPLASFAVHAEAAFGRAHDESHDGLRHPFELDRHRIIESAAFRRLERKTQVFIATHHDHFRTRLTHTLEVSDVARCLASGLGVNADLAESITLAHDLGHPPFGHAGELALSRCMANSGGFNHNVHSLRVVEFLEHPFPAFRGLNLTLATRDGLAAHATRYDEPLADTETKNAPQNRLACDETSDTCALAFGASVEAQVASWADRIAYNLHDLEDAIGAGFVGLDTLRSLPLWQRAFEKMVPRESSQPIFAVRRAVLDAMLSTILQDVIETARKNQDVLSPCREARANPVPIVGASDAMEEQLAAVESFLTKYLYRHDEIVTMDRRGQEMVAALFEAYVHQPKVMPKRFADRTDEQGVERVVCDYIAGMTDGFCEREHQKLIRKK